MKEVFEEQLAQKDQEIADARAQGNMEKERRLKESRDSLDVLVGSTGSIIHELGVGQVELVGPISVGFDGDGPEGPGPKDRDNSR